MRTAVSTVLYLAFLAAAVVALTHASSRLSRIDFLILAVACLYTVTGMMTRP